MDQTAAAQGFFEWIRGFGYGARGFLALGMALATVSVIVCVPQMFKAYLDYKKSTKETELEVKRLDGEIVGKIERLMQDSSRQEEQQ
jgi:hypothetical protein